MYKKNAQPYLIVVLLLTAPFRVSRLMFGVCCCNAVCPFVPAVVHPNFRYTYFRFRLFRPSMLVNGGFSTRKAD